MGTFKTVEQQTEIIEKYKVGKPFEELAEEYGCTVQTIRNILHRNGVKRIKKCRYGGYFRKLSDEDRSVIAREYIEGVTRKIWCV